jgi:hypothetical protein
MRSRVVESLCTAGAYTFQMFDEIPTKMVTTGQTQPLICSFMYQLCTNVSRVHLALRASYVQFSVKK